MQRRTWYKIALFLPFIWPLTGLAISSFTLLLPLGILRVFLEIVCGLLFAILFVGHLWAVYLCFALGTLAWFHDKPTAQLQKISWLLPLIFLPASFISQGKMIDFETTFSWAVMALVIGYFYVLLAHGLTWVFQKAGWVKD